MSVTRTRIRHSHLHDTERDLTSASLSKHRKSDRRLTINLLPIVVSILAPITPIIAVHVFVVLFPFRIHVPTDTRRIIETDVVLSFGILLTFSVRSLRGLRWRIWSRYPFRSRQEGQIWCKGRVRDGCRLGERMWIAYKKRNSPSDSLDRFPLMMPRAAIDDLLLLFFVFLGLPGLMAGELAWT